MTTGNQIAITFKISNHFASIDRFFFRCHTTKNGGYFKIKNTKIKFESSQKQIFETDTTYH